MQAQEAASPGFLRRMERRIERENKQTFIIPPSQVIPRGGGTRLFEGVRGWRDTGRRFFWRPGRAAGERAGSGGCRGAVEALGPVNGFFTLVIIWTT